MPGPRTKSPKFTEADNHPMDAEPIGHLPVDEQIRQTLAWIGRLPISQGQNAGNPIQILDWQRDFLERLLRAETTEIGISMARGGGKTTWLAMVAAAYFIGPLRRPRGHVFIVASTIQQSMIALEHLIETLGLRDRANRFRSSFSSHLTGVKDAMTSNTVRVLSSRPKSSHGIAPVLILADEPAQWEPNSRDAVYAALRTSLGKIPGSRLVCLGTRPDESGHFFSRLLLKPQSLTYAAPRFREVTNADGETEYQEIPIQQLGDPDLIRKANPALDYFPALRQTIETEFSDALSEPSLMASYRALRLNQGISDIAQNSVLDSEHIITCEQRWAELKEHRKGAYILGLDLGGGTSMTGACGYWPITGGAEIVAAFPADPDLQKRGHLDGVGDLYLRMQTEGDLTTTPGRVVDYGFFLNTLITHFGSKPKCIVCDRYRINELKTVLMKLKLGNIPIIFRGMGWRDGAEDVRSFRRAALEGKLALPPSTLIRSSFAEARTLSDPAGNEKLAKQSEAGRRRNARDDAVAACILAVGFGYRDFQNAQKLRIAM